LKILLKIIFLGHSLVRLERSLLLWRKTWAKFWRMSSGLEQVLNEIVCDKRGLKNDSKLKEHNKKQWIIYWTKLSKSKKPQETKYYSHGVKVTYLLWARKQSTTSYKKFLVYRYYRPNYMFRYKTKRNLFIINLWYFLKIYTSEKLYYLFFSVLEKKERHVKHNLHK